MFTGIIQELGAVQRIGPVGNIYRLDICSKNIYKDVNVGDSVAVNGACLTVTAKTEGILNFDVMAETIRKTSLAELKNKDMVNLEGSLKASGTLGGHFVLGHVDCVGKIKNVRKKGDEFMIRIDFPDKFNRLVVEKGSIAVDGVSLTISGIDMNALDVYIIPHTLRSTTLNMKNEGDMVNLEFDILGKYIARQGKVRAQPRISEEFLKDKGF